METLHGLEIGLGSVAAIQQQVSAALAQPVATAQNFAGRESVHYVDETGWPEGEKLRWLWIHATPEVTVFTIRPGRTKEAAEEIFGRKFTGVVNTDRYNRQFVAQSMGRAARSASCQILLDSER